MKSKSMIVIAGGVLAFALVMVSPATAAAKTAPGVLAQGKHLVEDIGLCADCHTPRLPTGEFDQTKSLQGSVLGFKPLMEMPWAPAAPALAGLKGFDENAVKQLLTTGQRPDGSRPLPPMPAFRFTETEAEAVVAFLRSLSPVTVPQVQK